MPSRLEPVILALALSLASCSDETNGPTNGEFDELCGKTEPIRLLPLDPERTYENIGTRLFADRYVIAMRVGHDSVNEVTEIWSVGRCGEEPVRIAGGQSFLWMQAPEPWDDIPFVCDEPTGRGLALDTSGDQPPHAVFEIRGCFYVPTAHGLLTILGEGATGPLVLQRWPEDPLTQAAEHVVLVDAVKLADWSQSDYQVLSANATEAFAITATDQLVAVSLDDHSVRVLAEGVREFERGQRYILWQGVETSSEFPSQAKGPIFLLDLETGETTQIEESASLGYTLMQSLTLESLGLLYYRAAPYTVENENRWVRLDTLEPYAMPGHLYPAWPIDDTRALMGTLSSSYYVFDVSTGEPTLLYDGPSTSMRVSDQGLQVLPENGGALLEISYEGETRTLARHATNFWRTLSGERIVTSFALGDDDVGDLVIVEPETLDEFYIDRDVPTRSVGTHASSTDAEPDAEPDLVSYLVVDDDPERNGIWLAKPAK